MKREYEFLYFVKRPLFMIILIFYNEIQTCKIAANRLPWEPSLVFYFISNFVAVNFFFFFLTFLSHSKHKNLWLCNLTKNEKNEKRKIKKSKIHFYYCFMAILRHFPILQLIIIEWIEKNKNKKKLNNNNQNLVGLIHRLDRGEKRQLQWGQCVWVEAG